MKNKEIKTTYQILSFDELTEDQKKTMISAQQAVKTAYSPYSNYQVGAALLLDNGKIIPGCNQENAVYPLGLCAERVALFSGGSLYPESKPKLMTLTIASPKKPGFPCGSCRQALVEFESRHHCQIPILIESSDNDYLYFESVRQLLPFAFDHDNIK